MTDETMLRVFDTMQCGLYIVTGSYRRKPAGCTCTWVTRASFSPPLMAIHLQPNKHTFDIVKSGKRFAVNILGESSLALARQFGLTSGIETNKFSEIEYRTGKSGAPILDEAIGYIDCKLEKIIPIGDHRMVIGQVVDAALISGEQPLVYDPQTFYEGEMLREESAG